MATIVLSAVGAAAGASLGGGVLGLSSVVVGRAVGATLGHAIDQQLLGAGSPPVETGRLDRLRLTGAGEGAAVAQVHGRMRVAGQVIWASRFREHRQTTGGGGKGRARGPEVQEYSYSVSLAIALCEGEIGRVGRVWADGAPLPWDAMQMTVYRGTEDQLPDPKIEAVEGTGRVPAYRGTAYVVIEDLDLSRFGNRVPQFSFEVMRPGTDTLRDLAPTIQGVALMPGTGEYALATTPVHYEEAPGKGRAANVNSPLGPTDFSASLDAMTGELPRCGAVSLIVSWFGDDLRCGTCRVQPKVEQAEIDGSEMPWRVSGLDRQGAGLVAQSDGAVVYGGTPTDQSVVEAIVALRAAGQAVTFYPFLLMEQIAGNGLPDPWTGAAHQPALPWRGRITTSVAPGRDGSPDASAAAVDEVAAFFGAAGPQDFVPDPEARTVDYTGPAELSYRRMILHYAHLCRLAGGVAAFCIGSEMRGLTQIRGPGRSFPAVDALRRLAADVRAILGPDVKLSYAADWSEYFGYQPQDGSGDVYFHLDPLWAAPEIDFIGIDNYMPLSDWREGEAHLDAAAWPSIYDTRYLEANIAGGEGFDWYYPGEEAREAQQRAAITDGAVLPVRPAPTETFAAGAPVALAETGLTRTEVVLTASPRWPVAPGDGALLSVGDGDAALWVGLREGGTTLRLRAGAAAAVTGTTAQTLVLDVAAAKLPFDGAEHSLMIELRPTAPSRLRLWVDGTLKGEVVAPECGALPGGRWAPAGAGRWLQGHGDAVPAGEPGGDWPGGALGDLGISAGDVTRHAPEEPWIYRYKDLRSWWSHRHHERIGGVWHEAPTAWVPQSKPIWFTEYGCAAIDKGTNQPNKFLDPKSSESALPRYSTGRRDDLMQMQYLRAMAAFWGRDENNPVSELYGAPMVAMERAHVWAWDARPYPYFPGNSELWSDAANYTRGHWITGRATARPMASVVEEIAAAAGVDAVDTSRLWGLVRGYALSEIGTARAALQPLMLAGGVDAVEREGKLVFRSRDGRAVATLDPARVAVHDEVPGDIEAIRQPEAEVAGRVRLSHLAADGDYEAAVAEAVFPGAPEAAVSQSDLSVALTGAEARAVAERWMAEARVARDRLRLALPPSQGALGAGDVIRLRDGRYRIDRVEEAGSRLIEAVRVEPGLYAASDAAAEAPRRMRHVAPVPVVPLFLDLPLLTGAEVPHAPHVAATADPWPGEVAVYGAAEDAGYRLDARLPVPAVTGLTLSPLLHAASGRFDRGAPLRLRLSGGALSSVGMAGLLSGANAMAISDGAGGDWEVFQFAEARLVAPGVYEVSRRLRGQLGTDAVMPQVWPEGSRVVLLDRALMQLPLRPDDRDVLRHYRVGPAGKGYDDPLYRHVTAAFAGVGLRPYAPVHLRASPAPGGAIETSWIRRTRIDGDSWAGFDVPLGEDREAYLVRVEAGGTVLRETVVTMPAWTYEADARDEDAGAGVATLAVAQISDRYGPGPFARRPLCGGAVQR